MLCGVGGKTVAEAKANISYVEFVQWCLFRNRYGSFHLGMRIDRAIARAAAMFGNVTARKHIWDDVDLSPFDRALQEAEQPELTLESAFATLSSIAKQKE